MKPHEAQVPLTCVAAVASWLRETLRGERVAVSVPDRDEAVVGNGDAGPIVERILSLGPLGLFGIVTEPKSALDSGRPSGPTAVFLNAGRSAMPAPPGSGSLCPACGPRRACDHCGAT